MENIQRKQFKKSFLKNIQCAISYDNFEWNSEVLHVLNSVFGAAENNFDIKQTGEVQMFQAQKGSLRVVLTSKGTIFVVDKKDYDGFESFLKNLRLVQEALKKIGVSTLSSFVLLKTNVYKLTKKPGVDKLTQTEIYNTLFEKKVTNAKKPFLSIDGNIICNVLPKYNEGADSIIAELVINMLYLESFDIDMLIDKAEVVNQKLYTVWYQSVTNNVKMMMDA